MSKNTDAGSTTAPGVTKNAPYKRQQVQDAQVFRGVRNKLLQKGRMQVEFTPMVVWTRRQQNICRCCVEKTLVYLKPAKKIIALAVRVKDYLVPRRMLRITAVRKVLKAAMTLVNQRARVQQRLTLDSDYTNPTGPSTTRANLATPASMKGKK